MSLLGKIIWMVIGLCLGTLALDAWTSKISQTLRDHKWIKYLVYLLLFVWAILSVMVIGYEFRMEGGFTKLVNDLRLK